MVTIQKSVNCRYYRIPFRKPQNKCNKRYKQTILTQTNIYIHIYKDIYTTMTVNYYVGFPRNHALIT